MTKDEINKVMEEVTAGHYDIHKVSVDGALYKMFLPLESSEPFKGFNTVLEFQVDNKGRSVVLTSTDLDEIFPLIQKLRDEDEQVYRALALCHQMSITNKYSLIYLGFDNHKKAPYIHASPV